jgi:predicted phage-related endonuclease
MNDLTNVGEIDRKSYIGGSDIAAIMGLGATYNGVQQTPLTVYLKKVGELESEIDEDWQDILEFRKDMEGPIFNLLRRRFDADITAVNQRYIDKEFPFFAAEIDFEWRDPATQAIQNGEVKTVEAIAFGERTGWGEAGTSDYPVHYTCQNFWGMGITGATKCVLAAVVGISKPLFYFCERDEEIITEMRQRAHHFWTENVLKQIPPEPISLEDCKRLANRIGGRAVEADAEMVKNLRDLENLRGSIKAMDGEKDEVMFKIASSILKSWGLAPVERDVISPTKDTALIMRDGLQLASWNLQTTTRIQSKELREAMPDIFAKFSKATPSRVLRIKKQK